MPRLTARVTRLEWYRGGGPAVARIVGIVERASDAELDRLVRSGELTAMAQRLGDKQLDRLISELQRMELREAQRVTMMGDGNEGLALQVC